jgi:hypothetical protein
MSRVVTRIGWQGEGAIAELASSLVDFLDISTFRPLNDKYGTAFHRPTPIPETVQENSWERQTQALFY